MALDRSVECYPSPPSKEKGRRKRREREMGFWGAGGLYGVSDVLVWVDGWMLDVGWLV